MLLKFEVLLSVLAFFITFTFTNGVRTKRMYALCPPNFIKIGNECYYVSTERVSFMEAHFNCKDKSSRLAEPIKYEDKVLRKYLNNADIEKEERWIGCIYNWKQNKWQWSYNGRDLAYQSFSQMVPGSSQDLQNHCAVLNPKLKYRWSARNCVEKHFYVCQHHMPYVNANGRQRIYDKWNATYPNQIANEIEVLVAEGGNSRNRIHTRRERPQRIYMNDRERENNKLVEETSVSPRTHYGRRRPNINRYQSTHHQNGNQNQVQNDDSYKLQLGNGPAIVETINDNRFNEIRTTNSTLPRNNNPQQRRRRIGPRRNKRRRTTTTSAPTTTTASTTTTTTEPTIIKNNARDRVEEEEHKREENKITLNKTQIEKEPLASETEQQRRQKYHEKQQQRTIIKDLPDLNEVKRRHDEELIYKRLQQRAKQEQLYRASSTRITSTSTSTSTTSTTTTTTTPSPPPTTTNTIDIEQMKKIKYEKRRQRLKDQVRNLPEAEQKKFLDKLRDRLNKKRMMENKNNESTIPQ